MRHLQLDKSSRIGDDVFMTKQQDELKQAIWLGVGGELLNGGASPIRASREACRYGGTVLWWVTTLGGVLMISFTEGLYCQLCPVRNASVTVQFRSLSRIKGVPLFAEKRRVHLSITN
jgi:hypothetical protein